MPFRSSGRQGRPLLFLDAHRSFPRDIAQNSGPLRALQATASAHSATANQVATRDLIVHSIGPFSALVLLGSSTTQARRPVIRLAFGSTLGRTQPTLVFLPAACTAGLQRQGCTMHHHSPTKQKGPQRDFAAPLGSIPVHASTTTSDTLLRVQLHMRYRFRCGPSINLLACTQSRGVCQDTWSWIQT